MTSRGGVRATIKPKTQSVPTQLHAFFKGSEVEVNKGAYQYESCICEQPCWLFSKCATRCSTGHEGATMLVSSNVCHKVQHCAQWGLPYRIMHGGCHIDQMPTQGSCELSVCVLEGVSGVLLLLMLTQISRSRSRRGGFGLKTTHTYGTCDSENGRRVV